MNELDHWKRPSAKDIFTTSYVTSQSSTSKDYQQLTEDYAVKASALLQHSCNFINVLCIPFNPLGISEACNGSMVCKQFDERKFDRK